VDVLLTNAAEGAMPAAGVLSDIDVLKVAHHGSNTSTTSAFPAPTKPDVAVITAGRINPYGHPPAPSWRGWQPWAPPSSTPHDTPIRGGKARHPGPGINARLGPQNDRVMVWSVAIGGDATGATLGRQHVGRITVSGHHMRTTQPGDQRWLRVPLT
jgi:hypothetical protein